MTLSVGFLGYGFMGKAHANALARLPMFFSDSPEIERTVIIGRDEIELERAREQLGFERAVTDWREALPDIDILYNLGPNAMHATPSISALERDIHVLCEKPLATDLDEAKAMTAAAESSDATAASAFNYRFIPAIQYAKRLIESEELGEIYHVDAEYRQDWLADPETPWSWRLDADQAGSGALGDLGSHAVDLLRYLCSNRVGEIESVSGTVQTFVEDRPVPGKSSASREVTVDDASNATLHFESGAIGSLEVSRCASGHKNDLTVSIHGSEGSLNFSLERLNELQVQTNENRGYETVLVTGGDDPYLDSWWPPGHVLGWEHTFVHENYEFLSAIASGSEHRPNFEDGLQVQRVLESIQQSAQTDSTVEIRTFEEVNV